MPVPIQLDRSVTAIRSSKYLAYLLNDEILGGDFCSCIKLRYYVA